ncbi:MAG: hypothetical protein KDJ75_02660 [Alphaproteobacteria bacterium]|nr:hypothetical protein [Alphaproteobacteria bacterium]
MNPDETDIENDAMPTRADMLAAMTLCSTDAINNAWIYGRMPPDTCCGMHPAGCRENGTEGGLYRELMTAFTKHGLDQTSPISDPRTPFAEAANPHTPQQTLTTDLTLTPDRRPG